MSFEEFCKVVEEKILDYLPVEFKDSTVELMTAVKNNDTKYTGVLIRQKSNPCTPNIYLNNIYSDFSEGSISMEDVLKKIADIRVKSDMRFDVSGIQKWDDVKERILPKLVSTDSNKEALDRPCTLFTDGLAVVYQISIEDSFSKIGPGASIPITTPILDTWGISLEELDRTAKDNIVGLSDFMSIAEVLAGMGLIDPMAPAEVEKAMLENPMCILTNRTRINGATALLDEGELEYISARLKGDYIILPSSIHEVIILPGDLDRDPAQLEAMVQEINATQVAPEDRLSDRIYKYDSATRKVVVIDTKCETAAA